MRKIFKAIFSAVLFLSLVSLYANFLHPRMFFVKPQFSKVDTAFLGIGRDISFISKGHSLRGKIVTNARDGQRVPLLIFVVGSARSSYTTSYSKFIDTMFLQNLPLDSCAVLYFDKRGMGMSEGTWYDADFFDRAEDVKAAADFAGKLPFVDSSRIIVAGHSQGGWIAQICLAQYPETFAAGISMAGPTYDVRKQLQNDYASTYRCGQGMTLEQATKTAGDNAARDIAFASLFPFKQEWYQLKVIRDYKHTDVLKKIRKPLLLLFGENDAYVYPDWCKEALAVSFAHLPGNIDTVTITGATHAFKKADLCYRGPLAEVPYSEECKHLLRTWLSEKWK